MKIGNSAERCALWGIVPFADTHGAGGGYFHSSLAVLSLIMAYSPSIQWELHGMKNPSTVGAFHYYWINYCMSTEKADKIDFR